jgi:hypothetical protein
MIGALTTVYKYRVCDSRVGAYSPDLPNGLHFFWWCIFLETLECSSALRIAVQRLQFKAIKLWSNTFQLRTQSHKGVIPH